MSFCVRLFVCLSSFCLSVSMTYGKDPLADVRPRTSLACLSVCMYTVALPVSSLSARCAGGAWLRGQRFQCSEWPLCVPQEQDREGALPTGDVAGRS